MYPLLEPIVSLCYISNKLSKSIYPLPPLLMGKNHQIWKLLQYPRGPKGSPSWLRSLRERDLPALCLLVRRWPRAKPRAIGPWQKISWIKQRRTIGEIWRIVFYGSSWFILILYIVFLRFFWAYCSVIQIFQRPPWWTKHKWQPPHMEPSWLRRFHEWNRQIHRWPEGWRFCHNWTSNTSQSWVMHGYIILLFIIVQHSGWVDSIYPSENSWRTIPGFICLVNWLLDLVQDGSSSHSIYIR